MIKLRDDVIPPSEILDELKTFQDEIDALEPFEERSKKAKDMFPQKNTKTNRVFKEIKKSITEMCNSTRRCVYCEDSLADEVEHIYPKDLFPGKCFVWENYVYACGPCNGPKNNKFAVFNDDEDGQFVEVNPPKGTPAAEPPAGNSAFINPREEDPLDYCILDLAGSFQFVVLDELDDDKKLKAEYTYNTVLRFNHRDREPIRQARENAFGMYKARLYLYVKSKLEGANEAALQKIIKQIKGECHSTVWKEMQRYRRNGILREVDEDLDDLFVAAEEDGVMDW
jgi:5-methylcytosine-specific restriction endonuclease McrA